MGTPLNQPDSASTSGAPYYQPVRSILYHDSQDYDEVVSPTAPPYPDLPDHVINETIQHHHFDSSDQLEGLLKVANCVAAREAVTHITNGTGTTRHPLYTRQGTSKRKHSLTPPEDQANQAMRRSKRQKQNSLPFSTVAHPVPPVHPAPADGGTIASTDTTIAYSGAIEYTEPRPPGIHTSAALFRQPSSPNKKSTRPPISKLFTSLELAPSTFLELQSAAKAYMLNPDQPDRQDCVGNRGKGDSDVVKLRLYNCVRDFLEEEEVTGQDGDQSSSTNTANRKRRGDVYFGEHVMKEDGGERKWIWPRDKERVVGLCVPLLRRMVTNERQRKYAVETRSQARLDGGSVKEKHDEGGMVEENGREALKAHALTYHIYIQDLDTMTLARPRIDIRNPASLAFETMINHIRDDLDEVPSGTIHHYADRAQPQAGRMLQQEAQRALAVEQDNSGESRGADFEVHVQTRAGLKIVTMQEEWVAVVNDVLQCPWFENTVKVVVRRGQMD